jgi:DNA-binding response OmpR family regulator
MLKGLSAVHFGKRSAPSRPLRILIADDNRDSVATLQALLRSEGHEVHAVQRSVDVLGAKSEFKPHVVILDLQMPDISGNDLARWLRSRHRRDCPLLIALTGAYTRPADKILSLNSGFDHYVVKPYRVEELLALMRS